MFNITCVAYVLCDLYA